MNERVMTRDRDVALYLIVTSPVKKKCTQNVGANEATYMDEKITNESSM